MRVLWFTNCILSDAESSGSGSWLFAMRDLLCDKVSLYNVCLGEKGLDRIEKNNIKEYVIQKKIAENHERLLCSLNKIVDEIKPDIIHVWGTESVWASVVYKLNCDCKRILEIQGLLTACYNAYWAGLTPDEIKSCRTLMGTIVPKLSLSYNYKQLSKKAQSEKELIEKYDLISTQSDWTRCQLWAYNKKRNRQFFQTLRPIRRVFYESCLWRPHQRKEIVLFTSLSYCVPFKGLHVLLKALKVLVDHTPNVKLKIAGVNISGGRFFTDGYTIYLQKLVKELALTNQIEFVGRLTAGQLVEHLLDADLFINPSFVESFSASSVEAFSIGTPSLLAYSGAMPGFSDPVKIAEYYNPLDYHDAAAKAWNLIMDKERAEALSEKASSHIRELCSPFSVCNRQLEIYSISAKDSNEK